MVFTYIKIKSYCLKCEKDTENIKPIVSKTSNNRIMILSKCANMGVKNQDLLKIKKEQGY